MTDPVKLQPKAEPKKKRLQIKPKALWEAARNDRFTFAWSGSPRPIDEDIKSSLQRLRARSREQAQNNDWVRRFLTLVKTNVVGSDGIRLQCKALTRSGMLDRNANQAVEDAWHRWGRFGVPEVSGRMSWRQLQRLVLETVARDGEVFVRKHQAWNGNPESFALELLDAEYLDVQFTGTATNGNDVVMGVEMDGYRRPVAYHFRTGSKTESSYQAANGKRYQRFPAEDIYHVYVPEWVWQTRGIPLVSTSLLGLKMLDGYNEAELIAARTAASKMGFFEQDEGGVYQGEGTDSEGNLVTEAEPGTFEALPPGVSFSAWSPEHPVQAYGDFVKHVLRGIASGLGVSYNSLSNDLEGVNYSSLRQGALEERAQWKVLQEWYIETFIERVYEDWLRSALSNGVVNVGGRRLAGGRYEQLRRVSWQPVRWPWVDPVKDMMANEKAIELGLRSRSDIIREQGRDPDDVWAEIASENERLRELGIATEPAEAGFLMPDENEGDDE